MFTADELQSFDNDGLRRLCNYFGIEITDKTRRATLIKLITEYEEEHKEDEKVEAINEPVSKMSVQVRRIYERMKEKQS